MDTSTAISELEVLAKEAGISINLLCVTAGYDRSTWTRWKAGIYEMSLDKYFRLKDTLISLSNGKVGVHSFKVMNAGNPQHPPPN